MTKPKIAGKLNRTGGWELNWPKKEDLHDMQLEYLLRNVWPKTCPAAIVRFTSQKMVTPCSLAINGMILGCL